MRKEMLMIMSMIFFISLAMPASPSLPDCRSEILNCQVPSDSYCFHRETPFNLVTNFIMGTNLGINDEVQGLAIGDFRNNGKLDFVVSTRDGKIIYFRNRGSFFNYTSRRTEFNFTDILIKPSGSPKMYGLATVDYNKDGYLDIIAAGAGGKISAYKNLAGSFTQDDTASFIDVQGNDFIALAVIDFNQDGNLDLIAEQGGIDRSPSALFPRMFPGKADGSFDRSAARDLKGITDNLMFGLTGGGYIKGDHTEYLVSAGDQSKIRFDSYKSGTELYTPVFTRETNDWNDITGITSGDLDIDNNIDLIFVGIKPNNLQSVLFMPQLNCKDGGHNTYQFNEYALQVLYSSDNIYGITTGDIDGDGDLDILVGGKGKVILLENHFRGKIMSFQNQESGLEYDLNSHTIVLRNNSAAARFQINYEFNHTLYDLNNLNINISWDPSNLNFSQKVFPATSYCGSYNYDFLMTFSGGSPRSYLNVYFRIWPDGSVVACCNEYQCGEHMDTSKINRYNVQLEPGSLKIINILSMFENKNNRTTENIALTFQMGAHPKNFTNSTVNISVEYQAKKPFTPTADYPPVSTNMLLSDDINNVIVPYTLANPDKYKYSMIFDSEYVSSRFSEFSAIQLRYLNSAGIPTNKRVIKLNNPDPTSDRITFTVKSNNDFEANSVFQFINITPVEYPDKWYSDYAISTSTGLKFEKFSQKDINFIKDKSAYDFFYDEAVKKGIKINPTPQKNVTINWQMKARANKHFVYPNLFDTMTEYAESDYSNNEAAYNIEVIYINDTSDINVPSFSALQSEYTESIGSASQSITFNTKILNRGNYSLNSFTYEIYLVNQATKKYFDSCGSSTLSPIKKPFATVSQSEQNIVPFTTKSYSKTCDKFINDCTDDKAGIYEYWMNITSATLSPDFNITDARFYGGIIKINPSAPDIKFSSDCENNNNSKALTPSNYGLRRIALPTYFQVSNMGGTDASNVEIRYYNKSAMNFFSTYSSNFNIIKRKTNQPVFLSQVWFENLNYTDARRVDMNYGAFVDSASSVAESREGNNAIFFTEMTHWMNPAVDKIELRKFGESDVRNPVYNPFKPGDQVNISVYIKNSDWMTTELFNVTFQIDSGAIQWNITNLSYQSNIDSYSGTPYQRRFDYNLTIPISLTNDKTYVAVFRIDPTDKVPEYPSDNDISAQIIVKPDVIILPPAVYNKSYSPWNVTYYFEKDIYRGYTTNVTISVGNMGNSTHGLPVAVYGIYAELVNRTSLNFLADLKNRQFMLRSDYNINPYNPNEPSTYSPRMFSSSGISAGQDISNLCFHLKNITSEYDYENFFIISPGKTRNISIAANIPSDIPLDSAIRMSTDVIIPDCEPGWKSYGRSNPCIGFSCTQCGEISLANTGTEYFDEALNLTLLYHDTGTGIMTDYSNRNHDGIKHNIQTSEGIVGEGIGFDGTSSYIEVKNGNNVFNLDNHTISLWVKFTDMASWDSNTFLPLFTVNNSFSLALGGNGNLCLYDFDWYDRVCTGERTWSPDWHLITLVQKEKPTLYVDGGELAGGYNFTYDIFWDLSTQWHPPESLDYNLTIGLLDMQQDWGMKYYFKGQMDEIAIWNRSLDAKDVKVLYEKVKSPCCGQECTINIELMNVTKIEVPYGSSFSEIIMAEGGWYRINSTGIISDKYYCSGICRLKDVVSNSNITLYISPNTTAVVLHHFLKSDYPKAYSNPVKDASKPAIELIISHIGDKDGKLKPGYIEDFNFTIKNNDNFSRTIWGIYYDLVNETGRYNLKKNFTILTINHTSSINITEKIYMPTNIPINADFELRIQQKYELPDQIWHVNGLGIWNTSVGDGAEAQSRSLAYEPTRTAECCEVEVDIDKEPDIFRQNEVLAGKRFTAETLGCGPDTIICLYYNDTYKRAYDDDSGEGTCSKINFTADQIGNYSIITSKYGDSDCKGAGVSGSQRVRLKICSSDFLTNCSRMIQTEPIEGSSPEYADLPIEYYYNESAPDINNDLSRWGRWEQTQFVVDTKHPSTDGLHQLDSVPDYKRKVLWISNTTWKAEAHLSTDDACPYGGCNINANNLKMWINAKRIAKICISNVVCYSGGCSCAGVSYPEATKGWYPITNYIHPGINSLTYYGGIHQGDSSEYSDYDKFQANFYEIVATYKKPSITILPEHPAFEILNVTIGSDGELRRGYEERVNVTMKNNDDDPFTLNFIEYNTFYDSINNEDLMLNLLTTAPNLVFAPNQVSSRLDYIYIPKKLPLDSKLIINLEWLRDIPDQVFMRNSEANRANLTSPLFNDSDWVDVNKEIYDPSDPDPEYYDYNKYRKNFYIEDSLLRAEMKLKTSYNPYVWFNGNLRGTPEWDADDDHWGHLGLFNPNQTNTLSIDSYSGEVFQGVNMNLYHYYNLSGGRVVDISEPPIYVKWGLVTPNETKATSVIPGSNTTVLIQVVNYLENMRRLDLKLYLLDNNNAANNLLLASWPLAIVNQNNISLNITFETPSIFNQNNHLDLEAKVFYSSNNEVWRRTDFAEETKETENESFMDDWGWGLVSLKNSSDYAYANNIRKRFWLEDDMSLLIRDTVNINGDDYTTSQKEVIKESNNGVKECCEYYYDQDQNCDCTLNPEGCKADECYSFTDMWVNYEGELWTYNCVINYSDPDLFTSYDSPQDCCQNKWFCSQSPYDPNCPKQFKFCPYQSIEACYNQICSPYLDSFLASPYYSGQTDYYKLGFTPSGALIDQYETKTKDHFQYLISEVGTDISGNDYSIQPFYQLDVGTRYMDLLFDIGSEIYDDTHFAIKITSSASFDPGLVRVNMNYTRKNVSYGETFTTFMKAYTTYEIVLPWTDTPIQNLTIEIDPYNEILEINKYNNKRIFNFSLGCGNRFVEIPMGEQCDKGKDNGILCSPDYNTTCYYCDNTCRLNPVTRGCGDNVIEESNGEECDDGNSINGDGCDAECKIEVLCGEIAPTSSRKNNPIEENGLILLYHSFNSSAPIKVKDYGPYGYNADTNDYGQPDTQGVLGTGFKFTNKNVISVPFKAALIKGNDNYTISFWFSPDQDINSTDHVWEMYLMKLFSAYPYDTKRFIGFNENYFYLDSGLSFSKDSWKKNDWYMFTLTRDDNFITMYLNGGDPVSGEVLTEGSYPLSETYDDLLYIGLGYPIEWSTDSGFPGRIDEFAVWNRTLSAKEVKILWDKVNSKQCSGCNLNSSKFILDDANGNYFADVGESVNITGKLSGVCTDASKIYITASDDNELCNINASNGSMTGIIGNLQLNAENFSAAWIIPDLASACIAKKVYAKEAILLDSFGSKYSDKISAEGSIEFPPLFGYCGDGIIQPAGMDGLYSTLDNNEQCEPSLMNNSMFNCSSTCKMILNTTNALVVDFNGPSGISESSWIKASADGYDHDTGKGWISTNLNDIKGKEVASLAANPSSLSAADKLLMDYHIYNSTYRLNASKNNIVNATYDVLYFLGGQLDEPYTTNASVTIYDITGAKKTTRLPSVENGHLEIVYEKNVIIREFQNFTFTKDNESMGVITGIVMQCKTASEIENGLDDDCNGIVDDIKSYLKNDKNKPVNVSIIMGIEYHNYSRGGIWENYTLIFNSSSDIDGIGKLSEFASSSDLSTPFTVPYPPANGNYYTSSVHLLAFYWKKLGGWSVPSSAPAGEYRVYLELQYIHPTDQSIRNVPSIHSKDGITARAYSNIFNVTDS